VGDDLYVYDTELRKPVHYAACSSNSENLKVLLSKGVDLRDCDKIRKTPLMYACENGRLENVKFIVENVDCNIDQKCRNARGPIHFAIENGHFGN
jgi:ankyrin repeat protein